MGRLRNLSQSLKAAAFHNSSDRSSPANGSRLDVTEDTSSLSSPAAPKEIPPITRETSDLSLNDAPSSSSRVRSGSRPSSQYYEAYTMAALVPDHIQELQPVFSFLSSHSNKLYQEGYFLKLNDLDIHGKPNADRNWTECFAQLVGTVLSLWDAAALDVAGQDGEVAPTFINLADASIKMIETLPTKSSNVQPLQNVLSVSTAGKNRYLLHFNSLHSLTQWTAGIRLSMFENASLQEVYTGSLIAGKGKYLNNIRTIMEKTKFREEDWCRVRFGAGTPWRRCWYVIEPADEKEWQKVNKQLKKRGPYDKVVLPKGDLKFYDSRKTKKTKPIATISDVYSAYAVYPQSKPLIEQSTLVKLEGCITIHSNPESKTEGFVFVMPEVHPAVSGFEMMLRFLFPIYDIYTLYGRPTRLIADTLDSRGLMFAMPKDRRYGYLDIIDVAGLIHTSGSDQWPEREWRAHFKELISRRMSMAAAGRTSNGGDGSRRSLGSRPGGIRFNDSTIEIGELPNQSTDAVFQTPKKTPVSQLTSRAKGHGRSYSESVPSSPNKMRASREFIPSRLSVDQEFQEEAVISPVPLPPPHLGLSNGNGSQDNVMQSNNGSDNELQPTLNPEDVTKDLPADVQQQPPTPVAPPMFQHQANDQPPNRPRDRPDLRRNQSRMSNATLSQLVEASKNSVSGDAETVAAAAAAAAAWKQNGRYYDQNRGVIDSPDNERRFEANTSSPAMVIDSPQSDRSRSASSVVRKPLNKTASEQSVTRRPLPHQAGQPVLDSAFEPHPRNNRNLRTPDSDELFRSGPSPHQPTFPHLISDFRFDVPQDAAHNRQESFGSPGGSSSAPNTRAHSASRVPQIEDQSRNLQVRLEPYRAKSASQMWQPGSVATGTQDPHALTAEEFVQQRAIAARFPQGQAPRNRAHSWKIEDILPASSPKKLVKQDSRPGSKGSPQAYGRQLSARDQQKLAKVTGGPLVNLSERPKTPDPNIGLIGTIGAREQEKKAIREGVSSHLANADLARRQQQAYLQQLQVDNLQRGNAFTQPQGQWLQQQQYYQPGHYPPTAQHQSRPSTQSLESQPHTPHRAADDFYQSPYRQS